MKPQFETTQLEAQPILGIRTTVSLSKIGRGMGALFGEVHGYIKQGGGQSAGRPLAIDHSSPGDTVDLECAIPVVSVIMHLTQTTGAASIKIDDAKRLCS